MSNQSQISETPETRSVSRPTLTLAIVLTIAWFAILAIAIGSSVVIAASNLSNAVGHKTAPATQNYIVIHKTYGVWPLSRSGGTTWEIQR